MAKKISLKEHNHQNFIMFLSGFLVVALIVMTLVLFKDSDRNSVSYSEEAAALMNVSANDDVYSIEMELKGTDLSNLDSEVPLIEKELNSK